MAKHNIIEELLSVLPANEAQAIRAKLAASPELTAKAEKQAEVFGYYIGEEAEAEPVVAAAHTPGMPSAAAPTAAPADDVKAMLSGMQSALATQIADLKKSFVSKEDLGKEVVAARGNLLEYTDTLAQIREDHRAEFGEKLDYNKFKQFYNAQMAAGVRFVDDAEGAENGKRGLEKAHDAFVMDRRTQNQIKQGVEAGVKQRLSSATVPGQTQSVGLTPAQQILAKQREGTDGAKSNAMAAAQRLKQLVEGRENGQVVQ